VLLESNIDAVYISTTNDRHFRAAMDALAAGKHVLCEKPLALSVEEARAMVVLAESTGLVLATNHHLPGSPLHTTVRELIASGRIGNVLSAHIAHAVLLPERLRGWRIADNAGGGVVMDITCHDASVLNPLLGTPKRVTALGVSQADWNVAGSMDAVMSVIEYESADGSPIIAQTHDAFSVPAAPTRLEVHGTAGTIIVTDAMTQETFGTVTLVSPHGTEQIPVDCTKDLYSIILDAFSGAIGGSAIPTATGRDGLLALRVALAVQQSATTGQTVELLDIH
jgi:1,5-anhydro-D-fructose reductase (1,5-anhydro-D-mannitol-forming)